jgi:hypothetical protein
MLNVTIFILHLLVNVKMIFSLLIYETSFGIHIYNFHHKEIINEI